MTTSIRPIHQDSQRVPSVFEDAYPLIRRAAGVRSAAAVSLRAIVPSDREDWEQEALVAVWRAVNRFDPARASLRTFVERVTANRITSLLRSTSSRREMDLQSACRLTILDYRTELRLDVGRVLRGVSMLDRRVAHHLAHYSTVEASRSLGLSRAKVYRSIGRLRDAFAAGGFASLAGGSGEVAS
jgi:RNA polymerase sigma factor (sigma-70 family)